MTLLNSLLVTFQQVNTEEIRSYNKDAIIADKCQTHWVSLDVPPLCPLTDVYSTSHTTY